MIVTLADQYLAQNAGRRYPLADDKDGSAAMPDNAILDFRCSVRGVPSGKAPYATLGSITDDGTWRYVKANVRYDGQASGKYLASFTFKIPRSMATSAPYAATATSGYAVGEITVSSAILSVATGYKGILFSRSTVSVDTLKVDSIQSAGSVDAGLTTVITGNVVLAQGYNTDPYLDGNSLRLDIFKGAGKGEYCQYPESSQTCQNVMFSINGEKPGSDGELRIVGESGVIVTPKPDEHAIEITLDSVSADKMSKQCAASC